jgi:acyl transferase domain-containing protein
MNFARSHLLAIDAPSGEALMRRAKRLTSVLQRCSDNEFEYICAGLARQKIPSAMGETRVTPYRLAIVAPGAEQAGILLQRYLDSDHNGVSIDDHNGHLAMYYRHANTPVIASGCSTTPLCLLLADISTEWWGNDWLVDNSDPWLSALLGDTLSSTAELLQANRLPDPRPLLSMSATTVETASINGTLPSKAQHSALFAFQIAALALLRSFGIKANSSYQAVASFSMGEPGGAVAAGELSLTQGAAVMAAMSEVLEKLESCGDNTMMVVKGLSEAELDLICSTPPPTETEHPLRIEVGAYLQEGLGTLTGDRSSLSILQRRLTAKDSDYWANPKITKLKLSQQVTVAYHSSYLESHRDEFIRNLQPELIKNAQARAPVRYWYNSVSGGLGGAPTRWRGVTQRSDVYNPANDAAFWYRALRERASTYRALRTMVEDGYRVFLEINTQCRFSDWAAKMVNVSDQQFPEEYLYGTPAVLGQAILNNKSEDGGLRQILTAVADIWVRGCGLDWSAEAYQSDPQRVDAFCQQSSLWKAIGDH